MMWNSVHRFSHGTMPLLNLFKNSAHYHIFSGLFLALDVYRSKFSATSPYIVGTYRDKEKFLWVSAGIWVVHSLSTFLFPLHDRTGIHLGLSSRKSQISTHI